MISAFIDHHVDRVRSWCRWKNGYVRIPVWFFFAYIFFRHLISQDYQSILYPLNLGIHEFGHLIFSFAGQFLNILGGSLTEVLAPIAGMVNFYFQDDYFALTLCFGWLSTALFSCSRYVGDARTMEIPLVSPFGSGEVHDWNHLLGQMGLLSFDHLIAGFIWGMACLSMIICLWVSGWIIWNMLTQPGNEQ